MLTVKELRDFLLALPAEYDDARVDVDTDRIETRGVETVEATEARSPGREAVRSVVIC
jgi:hypothetical protein